MEKVINIGGRLHNPVVGGAVTGANEIKDDTKGKMQNVINQETDAELVRLDEAKQEKLTFDQMPTEGSTNPVTSGGVYAADAALQQAIEAILLLIPSAASALNQLADKSFVNSSISTATATFRGTYNVVTDLGLTIDATHQQIAEALGASISTADNNDYCYVQVPINSESSDIRRTERYKFNGTAWGYEYDLNTSGYTAAQWAAINSGITAALVGDLNDIKSYIPAEATALNKLADMAYVVAQIIANIPAFKGQFTTLSELQAVQSPKAGDFGIVRTKDNDGQDLFTFYQYLNDSWNVYYILSRHPQRKPASTGVNGDYPFNGMGLIELPMNMREGWMNDTWLYYPVNGIVYLLYSWNFQLYAIYNSGTQEGLGLDNNLVVKPVNYNISDISEIVGNRYLPFTEEGGVYTITKPDSSTITSTDLNNTTIINYNAPSYKGVNVLTQDMMSAANTKYVIKYDYTLAEDIIVPANCVLEFDGGSISGAHTLTGNNTGIEAGLVKIFGTDATLIGDYKVNLVYPEWFGAIGDNVNNDTVAMQKAVDATCWRYTNIRTVLLTEGKTYKITSAINVYPFSSIVSNVDGYINNKPVIHQSANEDILCLIKYDEAKPQSILIKNVVLKGNGYVGAAITHDNETDYIANINLENVFFQNVMYGIYSTVSVISLRLIGVSTDSRIPGNPRHTVGVGVYIDTDDYMSDLLMRNCYFAYNKAAGVIIKCRNRLTDNILIEDTAFEFNGCETTGQYYSEYGSSGLYLDFYDSNDSNSAVLNGGKVVINNCYFETNYPLTTEVTDLGGYHNSERSKDYSVLTTGTGYRYLSNPDEDNTAELVIKAKANLFDVIVTNTHFASQYQTIAVVCTCNLVMEDCAFEHPGSGNYDASGVFSLPNSFYGEAIVKYIEPNNPSLWFRYNHLYKTIPIVGHKDVFMRFIDRTPKIMSIPGSYPKGNYHIDAPIFDNFTEYSAGGTNALTISNRKDVYVDTKPSPDSIAGLGIKDAPYRGVDRALTTGITTLNGRDNFIIRCCKNSTIGPLSDHRHIYIPFNLTGETGAILNLSAKKLHLYNGNYMISDIRMTNWQDGSIILHDATLNFKNVVFDCENHTYLAGRASVHTDGNCAVYIDSCSVTQDEGLAQQTIKTVKKLGGTLKTFVNNTQNVLYETDATALNSGTTRPSNLTDSDIGFMFFDISIQPNGKPIYYAGNNVWVDATGTTV